MGYYCHALAHTPPPLASHAATSLKIWSKQVASLPVEITTHIGCTPSPNFFGSPPLRMSNEYLNLEDLGDLEREPEEVGLTNTDGITSEWLQIEEPDVVKGKGRPKGSTNKRKRPAYPTQRDSSQFELAEALAEQNVWSQNTNTNTTIRVSGTQASQEEISQPNASQAIRGGRRGRGGRGGRVGNGVPQVPEHMVSSLGFN